MLGSAGAHERFRALRTAGATTVAIEFQAAWRRNLRAKALVYSHAT